MNGLLKLVVSLSLSGTVLIVLSALLKPAVKGWASKRWQYYIWLLVIARLLLPFGPPESPAGNAVLDMDAAASSVLALPAGENAYEDAAAVLPEDGVEPEPEPSGLRKIGAAVWENLWLIWLAGALGLLIRKITAYQSFIRFIRAGWTAVDDPALLDRLALIGGETGVGQPVELYVNPLAASPMLLGLFKPCVVLPAAGMTEEDFRFVALHELIHCKRRDGLYKWLVQLTVCVHWFNPLVHWMSREIQRMGELSCDEAVLLRLDGTERRAYGDALLRTMATGGGYKAAAPSATLGESGERLKERLDAIMKFKKPARFTAVLAALLAAALGAAATAAGAYTGVPASPGGIAAYGVSNQNWNGLRMVGERFTMEGLYEPPYLFEIGWNGTAEGSPAKISLSDGSKMTVYLASAAKGLAQDAKALQALSKALNRLWEQARDTQFPLTSPIVFRYEDAGGSSAAELAERYYEEYNLPAFKTAFAGLSELEKMSWLLKTYNDGMIAYFSVAADGMNVGSDAAKALAEKAYKDGNISFFSVLANRMSEEALESWAERAKMDKKASFQAMLLEKLEDGEGLDKLHAVLDARQAAEYKAVGVTVDGKDYYYQGRLVNIFLDRWAGGNYYTLNMNPKGSVNIKILRDADNNITGAAYLTQAEVAALLEGQEDPSDGDLDNDWDDGWNWDWDWDWDWDGDDARKAGEEKQREAEYAAAGITVEGKNRYYQGRLVNIFLDHRPDSSFYLLDMNPAGSVNIKIVRNADGKMTGVAYLTQEEAAELFGEDFSGVNWDRVQEMDGVEAGNSAGKASTIPINIESVKDGEFIWLGTFEMEKGDWVVYNVAAGSGERLAVGFAKAGDQTPGTTYMMVSNQRQEGETLKAVSGPMEWAVKDGRYSLFIHTKGGALKDVSGYVQIIKAG